MVKSASKTPKIVLTASLFALYTFTPKILGTRNEISDNVIAQHLPGSSVQYKGVLMSATQQIWVSYLAP